MQPHRKPNTTTQLPTDKQTTNARQTANQHQPFCCFRQQTSSPTAKKQQPKHSLSLPNDSQPPPLPQLVFFTFFFFFHFLAVRAFLRTGGFSPSLDSSSSSFSDDASSCTWFPAKRRLRRGRTVRGAAAGRRAVECARRDRAFPVGWGLGLAFALGLGLGFPRTRPTLLSRNGASHVSLRFPGLASTSSPAAVSEYSSSSLPSNRMFSSSSAGGLFGDGPHTLSTDAGNWPTLYVISCRYHLSAPARPTRPSSTGQK